jgi:hypothetical protein
MSAPISLIFGTVFVMVLALVVWLKYGERVELDRHDDSAQSDRTDLMSRPHRPRALLTRLTTIRRVETPADATHHKKTPV